MRVLYINNYREASGWSQAGRDYIMALDAVGVEVVPRHISMGGRPYEINERLRDLESRSLRDCDVVVQHVLPHMMDYNGRLFNIGLYVSETSNFRWSNWPERLNQMDALWFPHAAGRITAINSFVQPEKPYAYVPHATDVTRFERDHEPFPVLQAARDRGDFVFYTVGEFIHRKNYTALLKAFHSEFAPEEPVQLVIKTSRAGVSPEKLTATIREFADGIKRNLKLYRGGDPSLYKQEIIIAEPMTDEDLLRLHASCDCFVQSSFGEAWSIPAFDGMAMGKTPIIPASAGYMSYLSHREGWLVPVNEDVVFGAVETFADIHTGSENWQAVSVPALKRAMREAYENAAIREVKAAAGRQRARHFSYAAVGAVMKRALEDHVEALERTAG